MQCNSPLLLQCMWYQVLDIGVKLLIYPPTDGSFMNPVPLCTKNHPRYPLLSKELVIGPKSQTCHWSPLLNQKLVTRSKPVHLSLIYMMHEWDKKDKFNTPLNLQLQHSSQVAL